MNLGVYLKTAMFKCENCGKWTENKDWYFTVMMTKEIIFECPHCGDEFNLSLNLEKRIKNTLPDHLKIFDVELWQ